MITCCNVFHVWPQITLLLAVWPRDTKKLDPAARIYHHLIASCDPATCPRPGPVEEAPGRALHCDLSMQALFYFQSSAQSCNFQIGLHFGKCCCLYWDEMLYALHYSLDCHQECFLLMVYVLEFSISTCLKLPFLNCLWVTMIKGEGILLLRFQQEESLKKCHLVKIPSLGQSCYIPCSPTKYPP